MKRAEVLAQLQALLPQLRALGVRDIALFGSVARDEADAGSDIDVLVDIVAARPFAQRMAVTDLLEAHFGCRVDVVPRGALKPRARAIVEQEALWLEQMVAADRFIARHQNALRMLAE